MVGHVVYFLLSSFVIALITSAIRARDPQRIARETTHFFLSITVGVTVLCAIVLALEWAFIRPPF